MCSWKQWHGQHQHQSSKCIFRNNLLLSMWRRRDSAVNLTFVPQTFRTDIADTHHATRACRRCKRFDVHVNSADMGRHGPSIAAHMGGNTFQKEQAAPWCPKASTKDAAAAADERMGGEGRHNRRSSKTRDSASDSVRPNQAPVLQSRPALETLHSEVGGRTQPISSRTIGQSV